MCIRGFELELEPLLDEGEAQNAKVAAMNLLLYKQLRESNDSWGPPYRGVRLATHTLAGSALLRFALDSGSKEQNTKLFLRAEPARMIESEAFPLCMALYSFGSMQQAKPAQAAGYRYNLRFVPKSSGFVQFRVFLQAVNSNLHDELANFRFQIDRREYELEGDEGNTESQGGGPPQKNGVFYSRTYQLALGEHEVQINYENTYASAQFSIEPGQTKVVDLLLQEKLAQLRIVLPQGASLLVDGIPLSRRGQAAPVWQNVKIQKLGGYQYALPRLEYRLKLPAGKHHLLLQYEGQTWERKLYFAEGEEQYFELNWQLGSPNQETQ